MTFVVLAWLSVVLLLGAWMIAQSGRYVGIGESYYRVFDTHTGTIYSRGIGAATKAVKYPFKPADRGPRVVHCGPSDYFCEAQRLQSFNRLVEVRGKILRFPDGMGKEDVRRVIAHKYLPQVEKDETEVPRPSEGMMLGAFLGTQPSAHEQEDGL